MSDAVEHHIATAIARYGWPGLSAAIVRRGEPDLLRGWGFADLAAGKPVTEDTGFRIGSTGKTLTALALMALVEQGQVSLDDPAAKYASYPITGPGAKPIRLGHLVAHTSGIGELRRWRDLATAAGGIGVRKGARQLPIDELYADGLEAPLPPGVVWRYANHAITVLGSVIEKVTGLPFAQAAEQLVMQPLGMKDTGFGTNWPTDPRTAQGYARKRGRRTTVPYMEIAIPPAGSAMSRATDMARYLHALLDEGGNDNGRVVQPETFRRMLEPLHQPDPRQTGTGVVWWLNRLGDHRIFRHGGSWHGFRSCCIVAPDDGVALWLGLNDDQDALEGVGLGLMRTLLGLPPATEELVELSAGSSGGAPPPEGRYTAVGSSMYTLNTWAGMRGAVHVTHERDTAWIRSAAGEWRKGFPLLHIGGDDPTLFGADARGASFTDQGYLTLQALGTRTQPMILLNGRTPYVRNAHRTRLWTPIEELEPENRQQLEQLCRPPAN